MLGRHHLSELHAAKEIVVNPGFQVRESCLTRRQSSETAGGAHVAPGRVREGVNGRGSNGPLQQSGCRLATTQTSWEHVDAGSTPATRSIMNVGAFVAR